MPIRFAVKIVRRNLYMDQCQSDDLDIYSSSQVHLKLDYFLTCNISDNMLADIQPWHDGRPIHGIYMPKLVAMTLTLIQGHIGSAKAKIMG